MVYRDVNFMCRDVSCNMSWCEHLMLWCEFNTSCCKYGILWCELYTSWWKLYSITKYTTNITTHEGVPVFAKYIRHVRHWRHIFILQEYLTIICIFLLANTKVTPTTKKTLECCVEVKDFCVWFFVSRIIIKIVWAWNFIFVCVKR